MFSCTLVVYLLKQIAMNLRLLGANWAEPAILHLNASVPYKLDHGHLHWIAPLWDGQCRGELSNGASEICLYRPGPAFSRGSCKA
jgi:hypothetical protein